MTHIWPYLATVESLRKGGWNFEKFPVDLVRLLRPRALVLQHDPRIIFCPSQVVVVTDKQQIESEHIFKAGFRNLIMEVERDFTFKLKLDL